MEDHDIDDSKLQFIATGCLLIAAKYEEKDFQVKIFETFALCAKDGQKVNPNFINVCAGISF
jgi:hypothetical protein